MSQPQSSQSARSTSAAPAKRSYKDTLNLPKTAFPMKANLVQNEPCSQKRWGEMNLYQRLREIAAEQGRRRWTFHDGPPYTSGSLHLGTLLNRILKDFVVRARSMQGFDVPFTPGWDCHGLPIEHRVMTELVEGGKGAKLDALPADQRRMAVRRECAKYANKFQGVQAKQMIRLLTLGDYENPYLTMQPEYEAGTLEVFADLVAQGLVYRALKPVHWSIENQTALAEAELEYYEREDISVYVRFPIADVERLLAAFGLSGKDPREFADLEPSLMIWTTTPWTLPANLAVAVHPRYRYVLAMLGGSPAVVAESLYEKVKGLGDAGRARFGDAILGTCDGSALLGLTYRHPFVERECPVVAAEYVTLENGTGLVHTAPGHGAEDYQTSLREGLEVYCPVRADGTYDDTVPDWLHGKSIWEANTLVTEHLRASGHLYFDHTFTHSYPHDWRGKSPVIFRATEQWFISVDRPDAPGGRSLRDLALEQTAHSVAFYPEWGRNRMRGMLESRPDWCISRQRAWGLPIPAFFNERGEWLMTKASVAAVAEKVRKQGSDIWFTATPAQLLDEYDAASDPEAPRWLREKSHGQESVGLGDLRKGDDIFDVWFESGCSWHSTMEQRGQANLKQGEQVELYLEGSDQHRGWFQVSLLTALGATGRAPYRALLTHGFTVDKDGRKMSKSLGNTIEVEDLLRDYGADVCRWWVSSLHFEGDIKADLSFFDVAGETYRKVRNTLRFLLSNLYDYPHPRSMGFQPVRNDAGDEHGLEAHAPGTTLDAWALAEFDALSKKVVAAYGRYDYRIAHAALHDFCNDTLSAVYLAAVKDRLYCDTADGPRRRRTQVTLWQLAEGLTRLLAPILPHTADEAWRALHNVDAEDTSRSIHLETFLQPVEAPFAVAADAGWPKVMRRRDEALQILEAARATGVVDNPLDAEVHVPDGDSLLSSFAARVSEQSGEDFAVDFADLLGVSRVKFVGADEGRVIPLHDEPRCERSWKRDGTVKPRSDGGLLTDRDALAVGLA